jgi:GWxTD domain-containing protein
MKLKTLISLIIILLIGFACSNLTQISKKNVSYIYNPLINKINVSYVVFHKSNNISTLYYRIKTSELLYVKSKNGQGYKAEIKLKYLLLNDFDSKVVSDSGSVVRVDSILYEKKQYLIDSIDFKTSEARMYVLQINVNDVQKKVEAESYVNIDKRTQYSAQNFLIMTMNNMPAFRNYFAGYEKFYIKARSEGSVKFYTKVYRKDFPIAIPPFSERTENKIILKPDSSFTINLTHKNTNALTFKKTGIYYLQNEINAPEGLVIFRFYEDFPDITNASNMLYPLMYITTKSEFDKMLLSRNKKETVDNYWLELAGNSSRARELIRRYYSRVREANLLFTSYQEGWKTDRGIIYIIYGSPNIVYKNSEKETWIYGSTQSSRSIAFNFYRLSNPFCDNDFTLTRSTNYKNSWYNAVENWRK